MPRYALIGVVMSLFLSVSAHSQERSIWTIGRFDDSPAEFGEQSATEQEFVVPHSQAKDWGRTQQAVIPAKSTRAAARRILFDLPDQPQGTFNLKVGLISNTPRVPLVELDVNGHKGQFHQRPERDYKEGNIEASIFPQYSIGTLVIEIPSEFLRPGRNELSLTAVTDQFASALPGGEDTSDALLLYDALALTNSPESRIPAGVTAAEVTPTVFYKRENGRLAEVVSVIVRWQKVAPRGTVALSVSGWNRTQPLASENEFGEQRFEFTVPEFSDGTRARI